MITLFISFHYACLFISKHLRLVALFVCQPRSARSLFGCMPPSRKRHSWRHLAPAGPAAANKNEILIIFAQFCHKQLAELAKFS